MNAIEDQISEVDVSSKDVNLADKVNNLEKLNSEMKKLTKSLLDNVHDIYEEYSNKFDEFEKILQAQVKDMEAKLNLNDLHCKYHCEPLLEDTCVKTQAFRPKR